MIGVAEARAIEAFLSLDRDVDTRKAVLEQIDTIRGPGTTIKQRDKAGSDLVALLYPVIDQAETCPACGQDLP